MALASLLARTAYLDGEIAVLDAKGVSSFAALQEALRRDRGQELTYHVYDVLHLDGRDLTGLPLIEHKALLAPLIAGKSRQSIFPAVQIERRGPRPRPSSDPSPV